MKIDAESLDPFAVEDEFFWEMCEVHQGFSKYL